MEPDYTEEQLFVDTMLKDFGPWFTSLYCLTTAYRLVSSKDLSTEVIDKAKWHIDYYNSIKSNSEYSLYCISSSNETRLYDEIARLMNNG